MRKVLLVTVIFLFSMSFLLFINCEKNATKPPDEPEVKLVSPFKNEVLIDSVKVEIAATDDKGITQVEFIVDNEIAKTWIMPPYVYTWNVTEFSDSSDHLVYARAYDADGNVSTTPVVKVLVILLYAPTKLSAQTVSDTQILLTWQDNSRIEDGFRIERKEEGGNYLQITEVGANVTIFEDSLLTYGSNYFYRVLAYTSQNKSAYSNEKSIKMEITAPSNLDVTALDDQSVYLTWTDNCTFESGSRIERKEASGSYKQIAEVSVNVINYNDVGLTYGSNYYYRVRAYTSLNNSAYSNEKSSTTTFPAPSNLHASAIDDQTIRLTWTDNCQFEMGYRIERKTGEGSFIQIAEVSANSIEYEETGLTYDNAYTYRIRAFTALYVSEYSNEKTVHGTVTDIDGNIYFTIKIGAQVWMADNLKVIHYRNGEAIPNNITWSTSTTGAYCNYNNDAKNAAIYGCLYNWYAVNDSCKIAPEGWHVPTYAEWQTLIDYLGGDAIAGGKMKETGTTYWNSPNTGATNESGFSALPSGWRYDDGDFSSIGSYTHFWSSTENSKSGAWALSLRYDDSKVYPNGNRKYGCFSVRCVKD